MLVFVYVQYRVLRIHLSSFWFNTTDVYVLTDESFKRSQWNFTQIELLNYV